MDGKSRQFKQGYAATDGPADFFMGKAVPLPNTIHPCEWVHATTQVVAVL